ncbi:ATP-dependent DNA ligase [Microbacterium sp. NPDC077663]|uniref:DUF7882 family protein n=1 Tax=Microbacterium sp. NPDC077663 TaxID=3364189 RepID=UPI0037CA0674
MGRLMYEGHTVLEVDDRTLAHLEVLIGTKLRRGEPFMFMWDDESHIGGGRSTVWVHSRSSLVYRYRGRVDQINPAWVRALASRANSPAGLVTVDEPAPSGPTG